MILDPIIVRLREHNYAKGGIPRDLAAQIPQIEESNLWDLFSTANKVRHEIVGDEVHLCGIINAKSGHCPEDCKFCAQSRHYNTNIETYPYVGEEKVLESSREAVKNGATRFGIVTATKDLKKGKFLDQVLDSVRQIAAEGKIQADASLGIIYEPEVAVMLREAGLVEINHNLETSRRFYPEICTSHSYDDRINTIKFAKQAGLMTCSGGIFGMGENWDDRLDLAYTLRELDVDTIPLNFLHRIDGTPLERVHPMHPMEILTIISMFRLVLPNKEIKVAGGRELNLRSLQPLMFLAGANSTMVGNYLTTSGWSPEKDHEMIRDMGLRPRL